MNLIPLVTIENGLKNFNIDCLKLFKMEITKKI